MLIYHGSKNIIKHPVFGGGKPYNDYGPGFYCTENIELAKEWGCSENDDGYANIYEIDISNLKILNLNDKKYNILHWLALLLQNRTFRITAPIAKDSKTYLINNFSIDTTPYDIIIGYRADDSYFSFAEDFLNNAISLKKLSKAMKLGSLGEQFVLISQKSFNEIKFINAEKALKSKYFVLKTNRDQNARKEYFAERSNQGNNYKNELFMMDILRQEIKPDDSRLQ